MPAPEKVNELFEQSLQELGISSDSPQYKQIKEWSAENKWMMICQQRAAKQEQKIGALDKKPQYWVDKISVEPTVAVLNDLNFRLSTSLHHSLTHSYTDILSKCTLLYKHINIRLIVCCLWGSSGHELTGWLKEFEELGGIIQLTKILTEHLNKKHKKLLSTILRCFSSIMNNKVCCQFFFTHLFIGFLLSLISSKLISLILIY
jgi:hypothetical protein